MIYSVSISSAFAPNSIWEPTPEFIWLDCKEFRQSHINAPEISQDEDSHYERAQGDGVPHCVDEIQAMKDLLFKDDKMVKNTMVKRDNWSDAEKLQHILSHTPGKVTLWPFVGTKGHDLFSTSVCTIFVITAITVIKNPTTPDRGIFFSSLTCRDPFGGPLLFCSGGDVVSVHGKVHLKIKLK